MTPEERADKITDQFFDVRPIRRSHDPAVVMTEPMGVLTADIAQAIREAVAERDRHWLDRISKTMEGRSHSFDPAQQIEDQAYLAGFDRAKRRIAEAIKAGTDD